MKTDNTCKTRKAIKHETWNFRDDFETFNILKTNEKSTD